MRGFIRKATSTLVIFVMALTLFAGDVIVSQAAGEQNLIYSSDSTDFVLLSDAVPDAIQEIRYYSTYNFIGDRITGYEEPVALLTKEAAAALRQVSDDLLAQGYRLKIYDAYRPQMAVTHFMNWAADVNDVRMKPYFYPELEKSVIIPQGYVDEHSGHSRGSTVDLTLFDMATEKEVDMGGTFDYFGPLSHPDYTGITEAQYANRMILRTAMMKRGFKPLSTEWWHFTLAKEPYPNTYFTFPVSTKSIEANVDVCTTAMLGQSPDWITKLPQAKTTDQMLVVANYEGTTAFVTLNEKGRDGKWYLTMSTPGFIGKSGLGKTKEGDAKTPVGTYSFNAAFGIAKDPGCQLPYVQVNNDIYWSGDVNPGMRYNEMVNINDYPNLDVENSEHLIDYTRQYQYCLNISYNAEGTPGLGSAIFLHCLGPAKPYTGGCVAIPENQMKVVMQRVKPNCVVVIDSLENLGGSF